MDFKGWFRLRDRSRCDPLTISDNFSRYLLCCEANGNQLHTTVERDLWATFDKFGLPDAIRVDNGQPWSAPCGELQLTTLSVKILRLDVAVERIERGKPQQNGRHERMHLTVEQETVEPPAASLRAQNFRFGRFLAEFNNVRPHEALGQRTPASVYKPSVRSLPSKLPEPTYPSDYKTHRVNIGGRVSFMKQQIFISTALDKQVIGTFEVAEGCYEVRFCSELLGHVNLAHLELGLVTPT